MASSAAGKPSPPPPPPPAPSGWLSGLVSGAGRILAAVLGPESSSDATSSSPEPSQSPPPPRRARSAADQGNGAHFACDYYQFNNKSGKEVVLKDYGKSSQELASVIDRKDALAQLLMQETFSRSEYVALTKIIKERVVDSDPSIDEPDLVLPIAWKPSTQQHPVALRPENSPSRTSGVPAYSSLFDNTSEKRGLKKSSTTLEDPCTLKDLSHEQHWHVVKRNYYNAVDTFEKPRKIRPKLNSVNTSEKVFDASFHAVFDDSLTNDAGELRGFPEELKDISLLGTDNLTFSNIAPKGETARPVGHLATVSRKADLNKHDSATFYPYSYRDLTETFPVKVEPFDEFASLEPEMMHLAQKNDERNMSNDSHSVSKMILQEDIEAAPSSSNGLQLDNSSRNGKGGFNLHGSIPTKARSPAISSPRPSNRRTIRSWNGPPQQRNPASLVQEEPNDHHVHAKKRVGRPKKAKRSRNTDREVKTKRRL